AGLGGRGGRSAVFVGAVAEGGGRREGGVGQAGEGAAHVLGPDLGGDVATEHLLQAADTYQGFQPRVVRVLPAQEGGGGERRGVADDPGRPVVVGGSGCARRGPADGLGLGAGAPGDDAPEHIGHVVGDRRGQGPDGGGGGEAGQRRAVVRH